MFWELIHNFGSDYQTMPSIPFEGGLSTEQKVISTDPWNKSNHDNKINNSKYGRKPNTTKAY
jgi:hypothetical protein